MNRVGRLLIWLVLAYFLSSVSVHAGVEVLTYHNNNERTGANTNETILTPANVGSTNFGKLFTLPVDGYVYAQPLVVTNVTIPGQGVHDVVYVATEHDSVYAFDANSNGPPLWQVSFINPAAGISTVISAILDCGDLVPEIGITGTPVIDPVTGTLYVVAKTLVVTNSVENMIYQLHALDLSSGAEKFGGPVVIQGSVPGAGSGTDGTGHVPFSARLQIQRAGLLLDNGIVYVAFASHCDETPAHGWLFGYGAHSLALSNIFNTTPNDTLGGIWAGGGAPACDTNGNIFCATGNGAFDANTNNDYGDSLLKISTTNGLQVADYFTPYDQAYMDANDKDLGSGGTVILPDEAGDGMSNKHLAVFADKGRTIYLVNRDNLGKYNSVSSNDNQIVQSLIGAIGANFSTPAYFNQSIYFQGAGDYLKAFSITNAQIGVNVVSEGNDHFNFPGATPTVSANGTSNAIVWVVESDAYGSSGPAILRAYNATNLAIELYISSTYGARDNPGGAVKFTVPTVVNGKVYVGAEYALSVYGLGSSFLDAPVISPPSGNFNNSISITITDDVPGTTIYYTLDSTSPTADSTYYTGPFVLTNSANVTARATKPGAVDSISASAIFYSSNFTGSGTGLTGDYYTGQSMTFSNPPTLVRIDPTINFDWNSESPDPSINQGLFSVMWTGSILPQFTETYNFYMTTDDGAFLWVNGQLIIDAWVPQGATTWIGSIPLQAGHSVPITMEYFQAGGLASATLAWRSPSTPQTIIPQSQLFPNYAAEIISAGTLSSNGGFQLQMAGLTGKGYVLQDSTNLLSWISLETNEPAPDPNVALPTNLFKFIDPAATNSARKFYRTIQVP